MHTLHASRLRHDVTVPVQQFLKTLPANKRQIRPTKFLDFTAKKHYRQTDSLELQTLELSPRLKYCAA